MPDYIEIKDASGASKKVSADELAEAIFAQRFKVMFGANGSATDVSEGAPLPVTDAAAGALLSELSELLTGIGGTTEPLAGLLSSIDADTEAMATALGLLDNAIAGSEMQVDVVGALPAGNNNIGDVDVASLPALATGTNSIGKVKALEEALPAGTNAIGKLAANSGVDIGDVDVLSIAAGSNLIGNVGLGVRTSGGASIFRSIDLDETEEEIKGTAGQIYGWSWSNKASSPRFLKLYNATAASVTVGSSTPLITIEMPKESAANIDWPVPITFSTAITAAATTGVADADTGAPGVNDVIFNALYA